ncbi:MAG TPA: ATP-grasp domain-containing protein [Polyangia bacterium]|jgi:biotin carboxylase|nr:ATP-grasp domain-containing protein [Polyangia bacterium]
MPRPRVLLLCATTSYRTEDFIAAARRLDVEAVVGSDRCHVLAEVLDFRDGSLALDLRHPDAAVEQIVAAAEGGQRFDALVPTNDATAVIAAHAARRLGLASNPPEAAYTARNKRRMREALTQAGVPCPRFISFPMTLDAGAAEAEVARAIGYPCVLKPLLLSASRGVIRADDAASFTRALGRLRALLETPELRAQAEVDPAGAEVLVECFVPGREVALEGILVGGQLHTLALFDKPDPLDGPFFEETLYVTPSRLPAEVQAAVSAVTAQATRAMGLVSGPVHAELRVEMRDGVAAAPAIAVIEVAARTIGGLCARTLRFSLGEGPSASRDEGAGAAEGPTLEELVLGMALGLYEAPPPRQGGAAGVMMLPVPGAGVLQGVAGEEEARAVPGIVELAMTTRVGETLVPLPEGASYLGFLFARGATPEAVEAALREAHGRLRFDIAALL